MSLKIPKPRKTQVLLFYGRLRQKYNHDKAIEITSLILASEKNMIKDILEIAISDAELEENP